MNWQFDDLTAATGAPNFADTSPGQGAYMFNAQGTQHVIYLAGVEGQEDGSVNTANASMNELWWNTNGWHHNDLTAVTSVPVSVPVAGYAFDAQGTQHIIYVDAGVGLSAIADLACLHIHELWWDTNGWHHNDLTAATGAPGGIPTAGYAFNAQYSQHVIYLAGLEGQEDGSMNTANASIHELWWDTNGWHHNDLTAATGAPFGYPDAGYAFESQYTQHVVYVGPDDRHIHALRWDPSGWHHDDLTAATGAPASDSQVHAYTFDAQGTQHVVYLVGDHVHELWWEYTTGWHHNDLTAATYAPGAYGAPVGPGAYGPGAYSAPVGYAFNAEYTQHVVYAGNDSHIHELGWSTNGWYHNDLTPGTDLLGLPIAGYVFDADGTQHIISLSCRSGENWDQDHIYELWCPAHPVLPSLPQLPPLALFPTPLFPPIAKSRRRALR